MTVAVLVAGGAGFVGAHTCKALAGAGFLPVVLDNLSTGHRQFVRWGPLVQADLRDNAKVAETIRQHACVAVLHFAAFAYVGESVSEPAKYYENNVAGTLSLLAGMRMAECDALVFSSTCAVYGQPAKLPIVEDTPPDPINPYGASKLMVERILSDFRPAYGLRSTALRYFNACGADPDTEIGELRDPETHLIPRAMMTLQGYINDFAVFGTDFDTPDGTAVRDYVHVSDLADAHVTALEQLLSGSPGGVFNLGTGRGYSVREVLQAIEKVAGQRLPPAAGPRRSGDPPILVADPTRARQVLGFDPYARTSPPSFKLPGLGTAKRTGGMRRQGWREKISLPRKCHEIEGLLLDYSHNSPGSKTLRRENSLVMHLSRTPTTAAEKVRRFARKSTTEKRAAIVSTLATALPREGRLWLRRIRSIPAQFRSARMNSRAKYIRSGLGDSAELLYGLVRSIKPEVCVEIGSALGASASYIGMALKENGHGMLYAIDPHEPTEWNDRDAVDSFKEFTRNISAIGVREQVSIIRSYSDAAARD